MDSIKDPDQIKEHLPEDSLDCQDAAAMKSIYESSTAVKSNKEVDKAVVQEADLEDSSTNIIGENYKTISERTEVVQTSGKENEVIASSTGDDFKENTNEQESVSDMQPSEMVCNTSESVQTQIPQPEGVPMVVVASSVEPTIPSSETVCNMSESVHTKTPQPEDVPMVVSSVESTIQTSETICNTSESVNTKIPQPECVPMVASSVEPTKQAFETRCNSSEQNQTEITQPEDASTVASKAEPSIQSSETVDNLPEPNQAEINQAEDVPMVALGVQPKSQSSETIAVPEANQTEIIKPEDVPIVVLHGEPSMESTESECIMMESCQTDISLFEVVSPEQSTSSVDEANTVEELIANATIVISDDVSFNSNTPEASSSLNANGLSLLAQYVSDDDSDEVQEVPVTAPYQNRFVEIDSDTESDSDTDTNSDDSEVEVRRAIDLGILGAGHGTDDAEEIVRNSRTPKVKGELYLSDLPPIQDLHITVNEEECSELGKIQSIVEQLVIVNSLPGTVPLDLDTVLFLDKGNKVLGEVFDVLGQVSDPMYCVRFNSNKEIKDKGIEVGQTVYVAPRTQHTQFIVLANLMKTKGSDASWENDIEPPERYLDYSDDEEERTARRTLRNKGRPMEADDEAPKRQRPAETAYTNPGSSQPPRPYRRNIGPWQPHYQPPSNYNMAGGSWHSNYYQNYVHPHYPHHQYRMPIYPQCDYRYPPPQNMPHPPGAPHHGLVPNPYAMFPPPQLMQQPLFPQPPPPPPPPHGGY